MPPHRNRRHNSPINMNAEITQHPERLPPRSSKRKPLNPANTKTDISFKKRHALPNVHAITSIFASKPTVELSVTRVVHRKPQVHPTAPAQQISLRRRRSPDTSGGWGPQAKPVGRSLPAYTPAPSNPSSTGALVHARGSVARAPSRVEWPPIFGRGFGLRCFQPLSSTAWLPGVCPVGQPVN